MKPRHITTKNALAILSSFNLLFTAHRAIYLPTRSRREQQHTGNLYSIDFELIQMQNRSRSRANIEETK